VPAMPWVSRGLAGFLCIGKKKCVFIIYRPIYLLGDRGALLCHRNAIATQLRRIVCGYPSYPSYPSCPNPRGAPESSSGARSRLGAPWGAGTLRMPERPQRSSPQSTGTRSVSRRVGFHTERFGFHSAQRPHAVLSCEGGPQVLRLGDRETVTRVSPMLTGAPNKVRRRSAQPASE
jgi:hypothetical protein